MKEITVWCGGCFTKFVVGTFSSKSEILIESIDGLVVKCNSCSHVTVVDVCNGG